MITSTALPRLATFARPQAFIPAMSHQRRPASQDVRWSDTDSLFTEAADRFGKVEICYIPLGLVDLLNLVY